MLKEPADKYQILLKGGEFQEPADTLESWMNFLTDPVNLRPGLPELTVTRYKHRGLWGFYKISVSFDDTKASMRSLCVEVSDSEDIFYKTDANTPRKKLVGPISRGPHLHYLKDWIVRIFTQTELEHLGVEFLNAELPDLFDQLPNLKTVSFFRSGLIALPPSFYRLPKLRSLDISSSSIPKVPLEMGQLQTLRSLTFSQACPPAVLASLPRLTHLTCSGDNFNIPAEINLLTELEYLHVRSMVSAPGNFASFGKLEYLYIHATGNPAVFNFEEANLPALRELDTNCTAAFTSSVAIFRNLERLILGGKPLPAPVLETLTKSIGQLHALKHLKLSGLGITNIEFCLSLPNLESLDLSRNAIERVPEGFGNLHGLRLLDLSTNAIADIPADLKKLDESGVLLLKDNPVLFLTELKARNVAKQKVILRGGEHEMIKETGETFVEWLTFLTDPKNLHAGLPDLTISIDGRNLDYSTISVSFDSRKASLRSLKFDLTDFSVGDIDIFQSVDKHTARITSAETELVNPHQLRRWIFNLSLNTELEELRVPFVNTELPDVFGTLTKLKRIDVSGSNLTKLPPSFCRLSALETLLLNDTPLLELPDRFGDLSNLVSINLSRSKITQLPPSFVQLQNVENLSLDDTPITDLSYRFNALCNLKRLSLNGSKLKQLPDGLLELPALEEVFLERTGITRLP
ncbi:MAG TPA: leucine-rich repeat domain-containing protein [Cyclobacteriaceae bacterium]|nr:leucine-rich repeat domain-containing protein [Cyclobacteriaceae bacterium]